MVSPPWFPGPSGSRVCAILPGGRCRGARPPLLQDLDGDALDGVVGGWLRSLAAAGKPARPQGGPQDGPAEHVAIDGKWLRGVGDGPVKLFSALQHDHGVIIAQTRIPDETNETTQVKALLDHVDLTGAVVTADAAHASRETAQCIAGQRGADYLLTVIISSLS